MADEDFDNSVSPTTTAASSAADIPAADPGSAGINSAAPDLVSSEEGTSDAKDETQETGEDAAGEGSEEEEPVPFHEHPRWQQVQAKTRDLEAKVAAFEPFAPIVQAFKDAGYTDAQALQAAIESQQQEAQQRDAQASEQAWLEGEAGKLLARVNDPDDDLTEAQAETLFENLQLRRDLQRVDQSTAASRAEAAVNTLATKYEHMDRETVADLVRAGLPDRAEAAARRSHESAAQIARQTAEIEQRAIARYVATKEGQRRVPAEAGGGGAAGAHNVANMSREEFLAYDKRLTQAAERGN